ncbi:MAG: VWA domain-containing protein [Planctomycetota bacterium]
MFRFELPLLLLLIPLLIVVLYYFTKPKNLVSFGLRALIIILLVLIVAGFQIKTPPQNLCRIYIIDDTQSIFLDAGKLIGVIKEDIKHLDNSDMVGIIRFAGGLVQCHSPVKTNKVDLTMFLEQSESSKIYGTNIESALLLAQGLFPSGYYKQIFLFSDGNETEGDAKKVMPILKQENITLYTIPIGPKEVQDIKITYLEMPKIVRENQPIELKCRISSTNNTTADIQVQRAGKLIKEIRKITLLANQDNSVVITLPPQTEPIMHYEIKVAAHGINEITTENNYGRAVVQKTGKPKILYLSNAENLSQRTIPRIIKSNQDFEIEIVSASNLKSDDKIPFIRLYDCLIIDNLSLKSIPNEIKSFVSNGGGLLVVGGQNSFGLGGYQNSVFEEILPVWATPPEDLSVVIILDASGSMDEPSGITGKNKFQIASTALEDSLSLLSKTDRLEVIAFNQGYETIMPLKPVGESISQLNDKLRNVKPTGPTAIIPPIQEAITTLTNVSSYPVRKNTSEDKDISDKLKHKRELSNGLGSTAKVATSSKKHIILLSDGHSTTNESLDSFHQTAEKLKQNNITISVIATGENINEQTLNALTKNETLGKVYRLNGKETDELTKNLRQDLSVSKEFYRETDSLPVQAHIREDILKGIDNLPPISGYNRTTLKPNARLVASVSKDKEVLIADWNYGLGKAMVLNTSLDSKWMGEWGKWGSLAQLVTQGLRYITTALSKENTPTKVAIEQLSNGAIKLTIDIPTDSLNLFAQIEPLFTTISTNIIPVKIPQIAVGKYEVILGANNKDDFIISVFSESDNNRQLISKIPVVMQYPKVWQKFKPVIVFLRYLAESTDGKLITAVALRSEKIRNINQDNSKTYHRINTILIILSLVLFIADLAISLYYR